MIKRVNSQADYLAELLELIEGVDEELLTSDEKGEIIKEVSESGISVELRPRLAEIFSAQEKLLEEEITDLTAIESSIGKEIEGPLTQEQTREQMFIATEGLEGLDEAEIDLQTVLSNENRKVEASLEATPASADAAEAAEIRKNLLTGNNESGTHAPA